MKRLLVFLHSSHLVGIEEIDLYSISSMMWVLPNTVTRMIMLHVQWLTMFGGQA